VQISSTIAIKTAPTFATFKAYPEEQGESAEFGIIRVHILFLGNDWYGKHAIYKQSATLLYTRKRFGREIFSELLPGKVLFYWGIPPDCLSFVFSAFQIRRTFIQFSNKTLIIPPMVHFIDITFNDGINSFHFFIVSYLDVLV
jgi:hypothetical protein